MPQCNKCERTFDRGKFIRPYSSLTAEERQLPLRPLYDACINCRTLARCSTHKYSNKANAVEARRTIAAEQREIAEIPLDALAAIEASADNTRFRPEVRVPITDTPADKQDSCRSQSDDIPTPAMPSFNNIRSTVSGKEREETRPNKGRTNEKP